jgi:hypothetical protein
VAQFLLLRWAARDKITPGEKNPLVIMQALQRIGQPPDGANDVRERGAAIAHSVEGEGQRPQHAAQRRISSQWTEKWFYLDQPGHSRLYIFGRSVKQSVAGPEGSGAGAVDGAKKQMLLAQ